MTAALHYAHEHKSQIVHRDVSPANVIVGYDGNVKVVDFGIAKAAHRTQETQSGVMKGKTSYMSPEQCVGQPVDRRSDVFSVGIVLYEVITVRRLFKAANDFLTMSAIIHGDIPPPSTIRAGVPKELEAIIMKALAPDREDRYSTAEELRVALEKYCTANQIRTSTTALAEYMRTLFGTKPEPWLTDEAPEDMSYDFDGSLSGIVRVPEAALKRAALPVSTPIQPSAPIMRARSQAITAPPPISQATSTPNDGDESTEIVAPLPLDDIDRLPLHVGDQTLIVRAPTTVPGIGSKVAIAAIVVLLLGGAVFAYTRISGGDDEGDARDHANPNIKLPPPSNVPVATPDAAEQAVVVPVPVDAAAPAVVVDAQQQAVVPVDAPEEIANTGSAKDPLVKLRDKPPVKKKKKTKRPPASGEHEEGWDPNSLFPKKKSP